MSSYPAVAVGYIHPGEVSAVFHISLLKLMLHETGRAAVPPFILANRCASGRIIVARNEIVRDFLDRTRSEWLLFVDADMGFAPDTLERLLASADRYDRPVMGALCFGLRQESTDPDTHAERFRTFPTVYAWREFDDRVGFQVVADYERNAVCPTSATGAACILIHRDVLVAIRKEYGDEWFSAVTHPTGPTTFSEDMSFCVRVAAVDVPIHVDTAVKTCHDKGGVFCDEWTFDRQQTLDAPKTTGGPVVPAFPTFAVIASRCRPEMLATLRAQLTGQVSEVFVFDNGYTTPPAATIKAHGWPLHRMWNTGLDMAQQAAGSGPFNVIVLNDDVEIPTGFAAQLETGLRSHDDHWIAYPNWRDDDIPAGAAVRTTSDKLAGQTMSGWAFMIRGESALRFDEQFSWWYGDSDLERQVREAGKYTVCVGGCTARHLDPLRSTLDDPERLAQAQLDEQRFAEKWGRDPDSLWLAQNPASQERCA
jgi:GT2 family glycosyltransferase